MIMGSIARVMPLWRVTPRPGCPKFGIIQTGRNYKISIKSILIFCYYISRNKFLKYFFFMII